MNTIFSYSNQNIDTDMTSDDFIVLIKELEKINIEDYLSPHEKLLLNK